MSAFLCTGVLIRGSDYSPKFHSWDPSPQSQRDGGISFSFLRKDAKFSHLARDYQHGIIFYAPMAPTKPSGRISLDYLCVFPMDGATDTRLDNGCGMQRGEPRTQPCQSINILDGRQWVADFGNMTNSYNACGFNAADRAKPAGGTARGFMAAIDTANILGQRAFNERNEVVAKTWGMNQGKTLPIEAFFYLRNGGPGINGARGDQTDLYRSAGVWAPIIAITLPRTMNEDATFHYYAADQAVQPLK